MVKTKRADQGVDINIKNFGMESLTAEQLSFGTFFTLLLKRFGYLLLKVVGSRTAWFISLDKLLGVSLMIYFAKHTTFPINFMWTLIGVYGIVVAITLIYINELNFNPVETKINLGNKSGE